MKRGAKVIVNHLDVQEIIHTRLVDSLEDILNYLIKEKKILLTDDTMAMIYSLAERFSNQITDFVVANNRMGSITGSGADSATSYYHSTWQR